MYHRKIARIVALAAAMAPALWGPTATAQTIQPIIKQVPDLPIIKLVPDLVVTRIALNCEGVAVTVRNVGKPVLRITTPIVVRMSAVENLEVGAKALDKPLTATSLSAGQSETVTFFIAGAPGFVVVTATADVTKVLAESNETNNERTAIDERNQNCPVLRVPGSCLGKACKR